ncbi:MAG: SH3 domain-containing protein [Leptolyngbyaceae cyanobacterium]
MKYAWLTKIGLCTLLGVSLLAGCGRQNADDDTVDAGADATPPTEAAPEAAEPAPEPASASDVPEPVESNAGTAINPPQTAALTAKQADAQINLRSQPTTESTSKGYGLVGDPVKLQRAAEGNGGLTWYYVKFDESGAEGWIRGDFIDTSGTATKPASGSQVSVDSYTTDELFSTGSGGCGMSLWRVNRPGEFVFFNGLPDEGMWMKLDGNMTQFRRTSASGPEFYGQSAAQSFVSVDGLYEADVTVNVGSEKGYESVNIEQGRLILESSAEGTTELAVEGDAGC